MNEPTIITLNREAWLQEAVQNLRPLFLGHGYTVPELHVSVGWPSSGGLGKSRRTVGECWHGLVSLDKRPHLFISPLLDDDGTNQAVLPTLVHEVCHVIAGPDAKHGKDFVKVMKKLGLGGKPTATVAEEDLLARLLTITDKLGRFPHAKIVPSEKDAKKKEATRMLKCHCADCGYVLRTVKKWILEKGTPICPCNKEPMRGPDVAEVPDGGDE